MFLNYGSSNLLQGNKFKRLKKAGRESEMDERSGFSDDDGSGKRRTAEERVQYSLFGDHQGSCIRKYFSLACVIQQEVVYLIFLFAAMQFPQMRLLRRTLLRRISRQMKMRMVILKMKWQVSLSMKMKLMQMVKL